MKSEQSLIRKSHFLGTKIRNLRKRNHLTMEDLSTRCMRVDPQLAPSVSYLSMIERGKRVPSADMLAVIAVVFQKDVHWFLDDNPESEAIIPTKGNRGGIEGIALEPSFLFSQDILQIAIPEMLSQTGTTGRQFAHLLIRAHQEHHQNHFPDLERAAEEVGLKQLAMSVEEMMFLAKRLGFSLNWQSKSAEYGVDEMGNPCRAIQTSFAEDNKIYLNDILQGCPTRLKYDLAVHMGHKVLHSQAGLKTVLMSGRKPVSDNPTPSSGLNAQDILHAWRSFEASFFAGALLCPKLAFRQLLDKQGYDIKVHQQLGVSASVVMRRMTVVSPYPHWHYFDAYAPGKLKAVYRGNGIPLPWGNMRQVQDPCQHWAVFRLINQKQTESSAQISILEVDGQPRIYCCESMNVDDLTDISHVLCAGIDLNPAIEAQGKDATAIATALKHACVKGGGSSAIPSKIKRDIATVAKILNIGWIERGLDSEARLICARGNHCPRMPSCYQGDTSSCE